MPKRFAMASILPPPRVCPPAGIIETAGVFAAGNPVTVPPVQSNATEKKAAPGMPDAACGVIKCGQSAERKHAGLRRGQRPGNRVGVEFRNLRLRRVDQVVQLLFELAQLVVGVVELFLIDLLGGADDLANQRLLVTVLQAAVWLNGVLRHLAQRPQLVAAIVDNDRHAAVAGERCTRLHSFGGICHHQRRRQDSHNDYKKRLEHEMHPHRFS